MHLTYEIKFNTVWNMDTTQLLEKFNAGANGYDQKRRKLIPGFDFFYGTAVELSRDTNPDHILDIGTGTGLLAELFALQHPRAKLTLIDLSEPMLDQARVRFAHKSDVSYQQMDYSEGLPEGPFDLVVSGLSIHHLSHTDKQKLFQQIYAVLNPGGRFINADQALGPTAMLEKMYYADWTARINATDLSEQDQSASHERRKLDQTATLEDQLNWLKAAGFKHVDCVYKHYFLAVMMGIKS